MLDYLGLATETSFWPFRLVVRIEVGVFEPTRLMKFDVGGPFRHYVDHRGTLGPLLNHESGVRLDLVWAR